jgi:4-hydroxybenzoate polyprenyltransferase
MPLKQQLKANRWWDAKMLPLLAVIYDQLSRASIHVSLWRASLAVALFLLASIGIAGCGYLLNDFTDRNQDRLNGVANLTAGKSGAFLSVLAGGLLLLAWLPWLWLPAGRAVWGLLALEFILFAAYSIVPWRLKERGAAGLLADTLYACTIPLLVTWLVFARLGATPNPFWYGIALGFWGFGTGFRAILSHQLKDLALDQKAGARTFAARQGWQTARLWLKWAGRFEAVTGAAFLLVLGAVNSWLLPVCFALYVAWELRCWQQNSLWSLREWRQQPAGNRAVFINDLALYRFRIRWLPLLLLALLALRNPVCAVWFVPHLLLFENGITSLMRGLMNR